MNKSQPTIQRRVSEQVEIDEQTSFAEILNVNPEDYRDTLIRSDDLSTRSYHCLIRFHIDSLGELLTYSIEDLRKIRNLGNSTLKEILSFIDETVSKGGVFATFSPTALLNTCFAALNDSAQKGFLSNRQILSVAETTLSFIPQDNAFREEIVNALLIAEEAELKLSTQPELLQQSINDSIADINPGLAEKKLKCFFDSYYSNKERPNIVLSDNDFVKDIGKYLTNTENNAYSLLKSFIDWMTTDWIKWFTNLYNSIVEQRSGRIFIELGSGKTLQEIGEAEGLSRERVRQLALKMQRTIRYRDLSDLIKWLYAYFNCQIFINRETLLTIFSSEVTNMLLYCLLEDNIPLKIQQDPFFSNVHSDIKKSCIWFIDEETIKNAIQTLPTIIEAPMYLWYLKDLANRIGTAPETILFFTSEMYIRQGEYYIRIGSLNNTDYIQLIIESYYQDGIHVSDEEEIGNVRRLLKEQYGIEISQDDKYIQRKIIDVSFLCGRGTYKPISLLEIPESIKITILDMLNTLFQTHKRSAVAYSEIFSRLENDLSGTVIENADVLHSALKKIACNYCIKKDYISISENVTFDNDVLEYIKYHAPVAVNRVARRFYIAESVVQNIVIRHKELSTKGAMIKYSSI